MILLFGMAQLLPSLFKCRDVLEVYIMFGADQGPFASYCEGKGTRILPIPPIPI